MDAYHMPQSCLDIKNDSCRGVTTLIAYTDDGARNVN